MSMLVDYREGSIDLLRPLRTMGLPARKATLACADFSFMGNGPHGRVRIGVERKKVAEMLNRADRRFYKRQLPRMVKAYDVRILVVEGYTTVDPHDGCLTMGKWDADRFGYFTAFEAYEKLQMTIRFKGAFHLKTTHNQRETVHWLHALYRWWDAPWASHKSVFEVDATEADTAILDERTIRRQIFAQFPGVGWTRSKRVSKYFPTVRTAVLASAKEWQRALGFTQGMTVAERIAGMLRGIGDTHDAKGR